MKKDTPQNKKDKAKWAKYSNITFRIDSETKENWVDFCERKKYSGAEILVSTIKRILDGSIVVDYRKTQLTILKNIDIDHIPDGRTKEVKQTKK